MARELLCFVSEAYVPFKTDSARGARAWRVPGLLDGVVRQTGIHEADEESLHLLPRRCSEGPEGSEGPWQVLPGAQEPGRLSGEEVSRVAGGGLEVAHDANGSAFPWR